MTWSQLMDAMQRCHRSLDRRWTPGISVPFDEGMTEYVRLHQIEVQLVRQHMGWGSKL